MALPCISKNIDPCNFVMSNGSFDQTDPRFVKPVYPNSESPDEGDDCLPGWWILLELPPVPPVAHGGGYQLVDDNPDPDWNKVRLEKFS